MIMINWDWACGWWLPLCYLEELTCCHKYQSLSQTCMWAESPEALRQIPVGSVLSSSWWSAGNHNTKTIHDLLNIILVAHQQMIQACVWDPGQPLLIMLETSDWICVRPGLCSTAGCTSDRWYRSGQSACRGPLFWSWDLQTRTPAWTITGTKEGGRTARESGWKM